ncbi:nucleoid occlusion protein [Bacillus horti]|uniref:ParB family chromosome partitioning protein n=1 Tax=Caldalkalibacillus horti TaxID=77523 RepID=A0ABT9W1J4_9BACI|nr:nucleoid occlusion protein [Bacillus horti]MDQ0167112.1 ParB family chromosome partitioning protein [Bacillus horti]
MKEQFTRFFGKGDKQLNTTEQEVDEVKSIAIEEIIPNRYQPRTEFNDEKLDELCQTIKTHGVIQPIVVREMEGGGYELIAGERRWRAVTKLGMPTIPAIIRNFNDSQSASVALIENLQRENLTSIEEAIAYQKLMELHQLTQESLAQRLGKGQSTIANKIRLLQLPEECHDALKARSITERHARALLALKEPELQLKFLHEILEKDLNVKQTEQRIEQYINQLNEEPKKKQVRKSFSKDVRLALNTIRQSVDMVVQSGLSIETDESDHQDYYQVTIKIPKKN